MRYHVTVGDVTCEVDIDGDTVRLDGDPIDICAPELVSHELYSFIMDGASHTVLAERSGAGLWDLQIRGRHYRVDVLDARTKVMRDMSAAGSAVRGPAPVRAPMPGLVVKVEVEQGQLVEAGGRLLVVEAMKMENELTAAWGGRVGAIHVVAGQTVEKDEVLMEMRSADPRPEE